MKKDKLATWIRKKGTGISGKKTTLRDYYISALTKHFFEK